MRYLIAVVSVLAAIMVACGGGSSGNKPVSSSSQSGQQNQVPVQQAGVDSAANPVSLFPQLPKCDVDKSAPNKDQLKVMQTLLGYKMGPPPQQICASIEGFSGAYTRAYIIVRSQAGYASQLREQQCFYDLYQNSSGWQARSLGCRDTAEQQASAQATVAAVDASQLAALTARADAQLASDQVVVDQITLSGFKLWSVGSTQNPTYLLLTLTNNSGEEVEVELEYVVDLASGDQYSVNTLNVGTGNCAEAVQEMKVPPRGSITWQLCPFKVSYDDFDGAKLAQVRVVSSDGKAHGPWFRP